MDIARGEVRTTRGPLRSAVLALVVLLVVLATGSLLLDVATSRGLSWDYRAAPMTTLEALWGEQRGWVVIPLLLVAPLALLGLAVGLSRGAVVHASRRVRIAAAAGLAVGWLWQVVHAAVMFAE